MFLSNIYIYIHICVVVIFCVHIVFGCETEGRIYSYSHQRKSWVTPHSLPSSLARAKNRVSHWTPYPRSYMYSYVLYTHRIIDSWWFIQEILVLYLCADTLALWTLFSDGFFCRVTLFPHAWFRHPHVWLEWTCTLARHSVARLPEMIWPQTVGGCEICTRQCNYCRNSSIHSIWVLQLAFLVPFGFVLESFFSQMA